MISRFVTATGTGLGKTLVTAALCHQLRAQGRRVKALKPIVTGLAGADPRGSDPAVLLESLDSPSPIDAISPFRFAAPLAPSMAAAREGRRLDLEAVNAFCRSAAQGSEDVLLIEGVGGVMVPLGPGVTVLDWIAALGHPVIMVVGSYLGTLSHCLTALAVLRATGVPVAGIAVSQSEESPVGLAETATELKSWASGVPVVTLPRIEGTDPWRRAPDLTGLASS